MLSPCSRVFSLPPCFVPKFGPPCFGALALGRFLFGILVFGILMLGALVLGPCFGASFFWGYFGFGVPILSQHWLRTMVPGVGVRVEKESDK